MSYPYRRIANKVSGEHFIPGLRYQILLRLAMRHVAACHLYQQVFRAHNAGTPASTESGISPERLAARWQELLETTLAGRRLTDVNVAVEIEKPQPDEPEQYHAIFGAAASLQKRFEFHSTCIRALFFDTVFNPRWHACNIVKQLERRMLAEPLLSAGSE